MVVYYYIIVVVLTVCISSVALAYLLNKKSMLNTNTILSISLSSIAIGLMIPYLLGYILHYSGGLSLVFTLLATLLSYFVLILFMTILISSFSSKIDSVKFVEKAKDSIKGKLLSLNLFAKKEQDSSSNKGAEINEPEAILPEKASDEYINKGLSVNDETEKNILEKSVDSIENIDKMGIETIAENSVTSANLLSEIGRQLDIDSDIEATKGFDESKVEVDTERSLEADVSENDTNDIEDLLIRFAAADAEHLGDDEKFEVQDPGDIEKEDIAEKLELVSETAQDNELTGYGLDTQDVDESLELSGRDTESLSIEGCIDRAFILKQTGDLESAVSILMQALDKEPDDKLVFWIILDICAMYKSLGQNEFAKGILEGYLQNFEDQMDDAVKSEIQKIYSCI